MRSVTKNPPTTLMVAKTMAARPKMVLSSVFLAPAQIKAPTKVIPEIAFAPDINGVCNVGGTLEMTSKPRNIANIKMSNAVNNGSM